MRMCIHCVFSIKQYKWKHTGLLVPVDVNRLQEDKEADMA